MIVRVAALLVACILLTGCLNDRAAAFHARLEDGRVERFTVPEDQYHWVTDRVFWVESPSGIRVWGMTTRPVGIQERR